MRKGIIILILLLSINFVLAEDIEFNYPENVIVGEEFEVEITLLNFSEDIYDVKFEIKDGSENIAERFWEDVWKSTFFWMNDAIDTSEKDNEKFRLNINKDYEGLKDIIVKIRDSSNNVKDFLYEINISLPDDDPPDAPPGIYYELEWDEEDIENGKQFKINVNIFNLEDEKYDVRLWIEDDGQIISERYDKENDEWKSGKFYINEILEGPGNITEKIKIRIDEEYKDFLGEADLFFKIRDESEIKEKIDILEETEVEVEEIEEGTDEENTVDNEGEDFITAGVIQLGKTYVEETEDIKAENNIVYESSNVGIIQYSVYGFAMLCVVLCVLVTWRKLE